MTKQGLLIVFSGPSGVGKGTVLRQFLHRNPNCALSVSATTRSPREGEVDGREYHFISREKFGELVARGEMLEYASYNDNLYGTPKSAVDLQLAQGINVILEIEVMGAMDIKKLRPDAVFVFVMPPDLQSLRHRLESRGTETPQSLDNRLAIAKTEIALAEQYDYILVNDQVDQCCDTLAAVVTAAGCSINHMRQFVKEASLNA